MSHCHCPGGVMGLSAAQAASQIPSGTIGANSSQATLVAIALTGTGITGAISYLWSVAIVIPQDASYTNTSAPVATTLQSTTLTPQGPAAYLLSCVATGAFSSNTFTRLVTVTQAYPIVSSTLGPEEQQAAGPYAPTLSDIGGAVGVSWLTTATKVADGSSVSVTGSTTPTPSFTVVDQIAYRVRHRATDAFGRINDLVVAVSTAGIVVLSVAVTQPSNRSTAGAATWTLTPTGGTAPLVYSVGALTRPATSAATITGGATATPSVTLDKQGRYAFSSTVTDATALAVTVNCIVSLVWAPLVPGATPAVQSLAANTTTSGTITFITATGGSGSYTNALTLTKPAGSAAALSAATGLVTTITGMTNGEAYAVTCTSTDADAGSAATCNSGPALVRVATPPVVFSNPAAQTAVAAGSASITFAAASGGTGAIAYGTASLAVPAGSAATISGTNLGPFSWTTDVQGTYTVTQSATDTLGVSTQATGTYTFANDLSQWTTVTTVDFTTYDAVSKAGAAAPGATQVLQIAGVTQYTATIIGTLSTGGIDASGMFLTFTGVTSGQISIPVSVDATKKSAWQFLVDVPDLTDGTVCRWKTMLSSVQSVTTGTQLFPLYFAKGTTTTVTYGGRTRNGGTASAETTYLSNQTNPGRVCITTVLDGRLARMIVQDSDTFVAMDSVDVNGLFPLQDVSSSDTTWGAYAPWLTSTFLGMEVSTPTTSGTLRIRGFRLLTATPTVG